MVPENNPGHRWKATPSFVVSKAHVSQQVLKMKDFLRGLKPTTSLIAIFDQVCCEGNVLVEKANDICEALGELNFGSYLGSQH
jgi:hypothetical protein